MSTRIPFPLVTLGPPGLTERGRDGVVLSVGAAAEWAALASLWTMTWIAVRTLPHVL
jgi:hypothetical protein